MLRSCMWILCIGLVVGCGRLGFDELTFDGDGGPPNPGLNPLKSLTGGPRANGQEGEIKIIYQLPEDLRDAMHLEFRRVDGVLAPETCNDGILVADVTDLSVDGFVYDRVPELWHKRHSYRACFHGSKDATFSDSSMVLEGLHYANPAPGCHQPPCTPVVSAAPSNTFVRQTAVLAPTGSSGGDILLADLNRDDRLDVVIATNGQNVFHLNLGDGSFGDARTLSARTLETHAAEVGDFNNDGLKDIVFANRGGPSYVHLGLEVGGFDAGTAVYVGDFPEIFDVAVADINGDETLDLVFTRFAGQDRIYLGNGDGTFTFLRLVKNDLDNSCVNCLRIQDVNGDHVPDLIIGYNTGATRLDVSLGKGDGTFNTPFEVAFGSLTPIAIKIADLNNDKHLDMVVGQSLGGNVYVSLGDSTGVFAPLTLLSTTTNSRCYGLGVADFNGDKNVDIVFSQDATGVIGYLAGNGDGTFQPQVNLDDGNTYTTTSIDVGDIDGNGTIDFVMGVDSGNSHYFLSQ